MKDLSYVLRNFFTHKDFLVSPELIPGTIWTPLHYIFEAVLLIIIITSAIYVSKKKKDKIMKIFFCLWCILVVWEFVIIGWDTFAGEVKKFDFTMNLSLYPCSIFMFAMPLIFWGDEFKKKIAYGYVCTLGLLGALVNFLYPVSRLTSYSCISFAGFHTFFYHGVMLFTYLVVIMSGLHRYGGIEKWQELFLSSIPGLIMSIPANIINYSPLNADYMYFKGHFPLLSKAFPNTHEITFTVIIYALYILVPAIFYLPSYISHIRHNESEEEEEPQVIESMQ